MRPESHPVSLFVTKWFPVNEKPVRRQEMQNGCCVFSRK